MGSPPIPARRLPTPPPLAALPPPLAPLERPYVPNSLHFSPPKKKVYTALTTAGTTKENTLLGMGSNGTKERGKNNVVNYRHFLSNSISTLNSPLRCIAHIDIDAAYAAMEMVRGGYDPSLPLAVQQWQGLIAVNYPARAFGITRHESPAEAKKKCPHLIMVHVATYAEGDTEPQYHTGDDVKPATHKASLDTYRRESLRIIKVFQEFCPTVEKASIDESYLDLSAFVKQTLLERYPLLGQIPFDKDIDSPVPSPREMGVQIDWKAAGNVVPRNPKEVVVLEEEDKVELEDGDGEVIEDGEALEMPRSAQKVVESVEEAMEILFAEEKVLPEVEEEEEMDEEDELTWSDVGLSIGAELVNQCRKAVAVRLGYTCSAGVSGNKMLAKLGSGWKKPNAQTILRLSAVPNFLGPMKFQKIRNLGGKFGVTVKEVFNVETVQELLAFPLVELQKKLGADSGNFVYEIARGLDFTEVEAKTQVKSMLSSKNFRPTINSYAEVMHWLNILATELTLRLQEARDESPGLWPKTITFSHRSPNYVVKSHQIAFPFISKLEVGHILKHGTKLFRIAINSGNKGKEIRQSDLEADRVKVGPYSNIQLSFSGLEQIEAGQKGIERFFEAGMTVGGKRKVVKEEVVEAEKKRMKIEDDSTPIASTSTRPPALTSTPTPAPVERKKRLSQPLPSFVCDRCKKTISPSLHSLTALQSEHPNLDTTALHKLLIKREKAEHVDYHFAGDLLQTERERSRPAVTSHGGFKVDPSVVKKKVVRKVKEKEEGGESSGQSTLQGFFRRKA